MIGAIAGDIIGSAYERHNTKRTDFELFTPQSQCTDDTVLMCAVAEAVLDGAKEGKDIAVYIHKWMDRYPLAGYGPGMLAWHGGSGVASQGNGAAVRCIGSAWATYAMDGYTGVPCREQAKLTHSTPDGMAGARVISTVISIGLSTQTVNLPLYAEGACSNMFLADFDSLIPDGKPGPLARESVPAAVFSLLGSNSWEDAVRRAVSLGGDSDSISAMTGAMAELHHGEVPDHIVTEVFRRAPDDVLDVVARVSKLAGNVKE